MTKGTNQDHESDTLKRHILPGCLEVRHRL